MEEVKRKRGRPKKVKLPEEVLTLINEVLTKSEEVIEEKKEEIVTKPNSEWDVPLGTEIEFFDANLSYELTGYKPITKDKGLDFDPSWFTEARDTYKRTGHYCAYKFKSKPYNDFWREQYRRCRDGYTVNGYTITGDNYFFLNFYTLPVVDLGLKSGAGSKDDFPTFFASQYTFFHYFEMAKRLHKHACLMKARSIGFSEINASIATCMFITVRLSITMITCYDDKKLKRTYRKFTHALNFLDKYTDGGMFRLRLLEDSALNKKSGRWENINGLKVASGFQSMVQGVNGSDPNNIRGDRVELLIYDEAGSWPELTTAIIQGQELVEVQGVPKGIMLFGGTGGDSGRCLEGLRTIYYDPDAFKVLPYRHKYSESGQEVTTAFFIPYFALSLDPRYMDNRGVCDHEKFIEERLQPERDKLAAHPEKYVAKCAERCWNAEEAFNLEGTNKFNKIYIVELLTKIRALKQCPPILKGFLEYTYRNGQHDKKNINGMKWIENNSGKIQILEHPLWLCPPQKDEEGNLMPVPEKMRGLYVIGIDGIDIGKAQTSENTKDPSDFCLIVMRRAYGIRGPLIVAYYKDRPQQPKEAYKIAIKLAQYYEAIINIEATRMSLVTWARDLKYLNFFMKRPRATLTDVQRGISKLFGTPATPAIIEHQTDLIADFIEDYYYDLWFEEILDELNRYSDENKRAFDTVAALGMACLADEELNGVTPRIVEEKKSTWQDIGYYTDEKGIKHFGVIPKVTIPDVNYNWNNYDTIGIRTSDPRIAQGYI